MNILETERLIIRRFAAEDWKDLYEYLSDEEVVKFEPYGVFTEEQCKSESAWRAKQEFFWAVCLKKNNKVIGNIYFNQQEPKELNTWEIGYVFNSNYFGKGYATEACQIFLKSAFEKLKAHRVAAMCNPENTASWRLLERLKMRREGHLHKNIFFKYDNNGMPIWNDTYEYGILAEEYREGKNLLFTNLETERLILKNIDTDDRDFIFSQFSDDAVTKYLFDEEPLTDIQGADEIINFYIKPEPRLQHRWVIVRRSDGMKMGTCGFHCWNRREGKVEVGYDLKEEFWGNGYMREAMKEIIAFAKDKMNIKEINACVYFDNERSTRLAENLGFVLSGSTNELFRDKEYLHNIYSLYLTN